MCEPHPPDLTEETQHYDGGVSIWELVGKQAKSKAVVAVARKLAVLLHRLWTTQEQYMPFYEQAA